MVDPVRFCPDRSVNRAEMATFLARALELVEIPEPTPDADDTHVVQIVQGRP